MEIGFQPYSVRGGRQVVRNCVSSFGISVRRKALPDLLIVGRDANCQGYLKRGRNWSRPPHCGCPVVYAIPDPHIERWLLLDSAASRPCSAGL